MKPILLISVAFLTANLALPAIAAEFDYSSLKGSWEVKGVAVPDEGVQALVKDDPQYMGAVVEFSDNAIKWTKGTETKPVDPAIDDCAADPSVAPWVADPDEPDQTPIEGGFNVMCGDDQWGTVVPVDEKTVELYWYDNGVLTLTHK